MDKDTGAEHGSPWRRRLAATRRQTLRITPGCLAALVVLALPYGRSAAAAPAPGLPVTIGDSVVTLNGPWKFHTGDDPRWADPRFDDSAWETVDLTAPPGAHDDDVGFTGYVPGWMARGHAGYWGYAWYRLKVLVAAPRGERLALAGPLYVDSAYQAYFDGRLLGGFGDFSGAEPGVYSRRPLVFPLALPARPDGAAIPAVLAIRTWMGRGTAGSSAVPPDLGGIHIAPALGEASGIDARRQQQWLEIFRGYMVDAVPAIACVLIALMAWSLAPFDRADAAYRWLIAAILLTGAARANQPLWAWTHLESLHTFDLIRNVTLTPLMLGAWMMAWRAWFRLGRPAWLAACTAALTALYMGAQLLYRPWYSARLPPPAAAGLHLLVVWVRLLFVALLALITWLGIRRRGTEGWLALPAVLLSAAVVFPLELSALHVPGIWFPFGTGLSRTEVAIVALDAILFAMLVHRLRRYARLCRGMETPPPAIAP